MQLKIRCFLESLQHFWGFWSCLCSRRYAADIHHPLLRVARGDRYCISPLLGWVSWPVLALGALTRSGDYFLSKRWYIGGAATARHHSGHWAIFSARAGTYSDLQSPSSDRYTQGYTFSYCILSHIKPQKLRFTIHQPSFRSLSEKILPIQPCIWVQYYFWSLLFLSMSPRNYYLSPALVKVASGSTQ